MPPNVEFVPDMVVLPAVWVIIPGFVAVRFPEKTASWEAKLNVPPVTEASTPLKVPPKVNVPEVTDVAPVTVRASVVVVAVDELVSLFRELPFVVRV